MTSTNFPDYQSLGIDRTAFFERIGPALPPSSFSTLDLEGALGTEIDAMVALFASVGAGLQTLTLESTPNLQHLAELGALPDNLRQRVQKNSDPDLFDFGKDLRLYDLSDLHTLKTYPRLGVMGLRQILSTLL